MKILIQFSTTYLYERTFSFVTTIKTQHLSWIEISRALCFTVTSLKPKMHTYSKQAGTKVTLSLKKYNN